MGGVIIVFRARDFTNVGVVLKMKSTLLWADIGDLISRFFWGSGSGLDPSRQLSLHRSKIALAKQLLVAR